MVITNSIYEHYKKKASWTSHECVCLLKQLDPNKVKEEDIVNSEEQNFLNHLKTIKLTKCKDEYGFNPMKLIEQAEIKGLKIPDPLKIIVTHIDGETQYSWLDDTKKKKSINDPLFQHYKKEPYWKKYECIALLCGINSISLLETHKGRTDHFTKECWDLDDLMKLATSSKQLSCIGTPEDQFKIIFEAIPFLKWADSVKLSIPEPFKEMISDKMEENHKTNKDKNIDPHTRTEPQKQNLLTIDLEDKNLTDELKAAMMAWKELYMGKKDIDLLKGNSGHLQTIKKWVTEYCPQEQYGKLYNESGKICKATLERIAKIVNPNKSGGATKTR